MGSYRKQHDGDAYLQQYPLIALLADGAGGAASPSRRRSAVPVACDGHRGRVGTSLRIRCWPADGGEGSNGPEFPSPTSKSRLPIWTPDAEELASKDIFGGERRFQSRRDDVERQFFYTGCNCLMALSLYCFS